MQRPALTHSAHTAASDGYPAVAIVTPRATPKQFVSFAFDDNAEED